MNKKLILLLLLFCCFTIEAQDTTAVAKVKKVVFTQKNIHVDNDSIVSKAFAKNFKIKYKDPDFVYEYKTPEKNAWDRFKDWLASILRNLFNLSSDAASSNLTAIIIKVIAIAIIIFVIYLITKAILNKEGQWIFGKNSDKKIIDYTDFEKNIHLVDFEKLIQNTLKSGEKRLSIRYYYLWLLKKMAQNNLIEWDVEKTNSDYLYELKDQAQKDDFSYLSYLYNYIWYGEFELDDQTFEKAKTAFEKTIKSLGNG